MKEELDQLLCPPYPLIFAQRNLPKTQMGQGFACGDGWFDLVDVLCERLQYETGHNKAPQLVAAQVTEKFGGLRFYPSSSPLNH